MGPIYNRIHLGLEISPELPWQNVSVTNSLFWGPFFLPQKGPRARMSILDPKIRSWAQKSFPGHEKTKDARWKTMQNPGLGIPNGANKCKLWPKTILKGILKILPYGVPWIGDFERWGHNGGSKMNIFAPLEALWAPTWNHFGFIWEFVRCLDQVNAQGLAPGGSTGHQQSLLYLRRGPI